MTIDENRAVAKAWVKFNMACGHYTTLQPTDLAAIVDMEVTEVINHKDAVFLMNYYQVKEFYEQNPELAGDVKKKLENI